MIEITANDGTSLSAYRADPVDQPKGAVVVLQDASGITPDIQKIADLFAAEGYVAIAPSLIERMKQADGASHDQASQTDGAAIAEISKTQAISDIQAAVNAVKDAGKVAIVGYRRGGDLAYAAANRVSGIACVVGYDGCETVSDYHEKRKVPTLLHFGENDPRIPPEQITQFRAHRPDVSAFIYPGAHDLGSDEPDGNPQGAAQTALRRTLHWISQYVEGQPPILLKNAGAYAQAKTEKKKKKKSGDDDLGPPMN